jgi:hypothetical protein
MEPFVNDHAMYQLERLLKELEDAGTYPLSAIEKCHQEAWQLIDEIAMIPSGRGKQDAYDRVYGTKSVGPSKVFKLRVRYKYREGDNFPTVGSIASSRSQPDIRF